MRKKRGEITLCAFGSERQNILSPQTTGTPDLELHWKSFASFTLDWYGSFTLV